MGKQFAKQPAHGRLVVDGSTTRGIAPAGTYVFTVFNNAGYGWIAAGILEHLGAPGAIVLRIVVDERNAFGIVEVARLLTVRTSRLGIDN